MLARVRHYYYYIFSKAAHLILIYRLTGFFYIYQLMILWCYFYLAYWQIGISDTGVILLAAIIKVIVRLKSEKRVKKMAEHVGTCEVLRDQTWQTISTAELVPGDVFQVTPHLTVPVDAVILKGDIIVDESSLTGKFSWRIY